MRRDESKEAGFEPASFASRVSPRSRGRLDTSTGPATQASTTLAAGFERAVSAFDLDAEVRLGEVETDEFDEELRRLSEDGVDLVVVGARVM